MTDLFKNFASQPGESENKYFLNICLSFKKVLNETQNIEILEKEMEKILNAIEAVKEKSEKKEIFKKDEEEKLFQKFFHEFKRYIFFLEKKEKRNNFQDLLDILNEIIKIFKNKKMI